jgi:hypothetical protein
VANGFRVGQARRGGYFVDTVAATTEEDEREGNLEKAFVALPVVGHSGQGALAVGQFTPLTYQWDPNNQLTETLPFALADAVDGTRELRKNLYLLGVGAVDHDDEGSTRRLSVQGEYVASPRLALTADLESLGGKENDLGEIVAVTYYPLKLPVLRLTAEMVQRKGDRAFTLFVRGQF